MFETILGIVKVCPICNDALLQTGNVYKYHYICKCGDKIAKSDVLFLATWKWNGMMRKIENIEEGKKEDGQLDRQSE